MSKRKATGGMSSVLLPLFIRDTSGNGLSGLAYNTAGLTAKYRREGAATWTPFSLADPTSSGGVGHWVSGGLIADGGIAGSYELGVPNEAVAAAAGVRWVAIQIYGAASMKECLIEIELDKFDYQDGRRGGLTALPDANADASGGLPVFDANKKLPAKLAAGDIANEAITASTIKDDAVSKLQNGLATSSQLDSAVWAQTRFRFSIPEKIERPDSGSTTYTFGITTYNASGALTNLDALPTVAAYYADGTSASAALGSVTKPVGTTGLYQFTFTTYSADASPTQIRFVGTGTMASTALGMADYTIIVDDISPSFTAEDRDILGVIAEIAAAVQTKTDALPSTPAARSDIPTTSQIATALLDLANGVENGVTVRTMLRRTAAMLFGKVTGAGTGEEVFYGADGTTRRVTVNADGNGNRESVAFDS